MDVARNFLASPATFYSRAHFKNSPFYASSSSSSSSVLMLHDQVAPLPTYSLSRHLLHASVHIQDQPLHLLRDNETSEATMERKLMVASFLSNEENDSDDNRLGESNGNYRVQLLQTPGLWYLFPSSGIMQSVQHKTGEILDDEVENVVDLARKALAASKVAAVLAEQSKLLVTDPDTHPSRPSLVPSNLDHFLLEEESHVKSTQLLKRRSKRRRVPKPKVVVQESNHLEKTNLQKKRFSDVPDQNDHLWLFVDLKTKLLTAKEESALIVKIQDNMRLQEVKSKLQTQFGREPTLVEWGNAAGLSPRELQSQLHIQNISREKLIHANYRLVVHIAKKYQGQGLSFQDLLQEGSMGLMKSVEKFKSQAGCRFATYAYWWVRQNIRKAIFHHSRTIRLPDNVYGLLSKVKEAKRVCIQQGCHYPTKEEVAQCAGMSVEKMDKLLASVRTPLSMQQSVWSDQDAIHQEVTADTAIEATSVTVEKQLMRRHARNLLVMLNPKERKILRLRFGIENGEEKSLSEIGDVFGLSKERVRQLESQALHKLKQCLDSEGLKAYEHLLF